MVVQHILAVRKGRREIKVPVAGKDEPKPELQDGEADPEKVEDDIKKEEGEDEVPKVKSKEGESIEEKKEEESSGPMETVEVEVNYYYDYFFPDIRIIILS